MSKMDNLRAMREARYEQARARAATPANKPANKPANPKASQAATASPESAAGPVAPETELCGHRAISGRTCTREAGHAAKSHRYA